jgi:hypothetical protein
VDPGELPAKLRKASGFNVEVDAMPGGFVCSGRLKRRIDNAAVREAAAGREPLGTLFSSAQRELYRRHVPDDVALDELSVLGPVLVLKLRSRPEGFARGLVAELWLYPDNSRVLELSTKCDPDEAFQVAAETRVFLSGRGIDLSGEQEAKTRKALEFFAERL